jgi:fibronectin type 3 domain-containing protein
MFVIAGLGGAGLSTCAHASQPVELTWNPSTDPYVVAYKIYYGTQSHVYSSSITYGDISDVTISGLADGQTYYFAVSAVDNEGNESALSGEAVYTVPGASSGSLTVVGSTAALQAVQVSWTASPDADVYGYAVYYGTQSGVYTNSVIFYGATEGIITGLAGNTTFYFAVAPIDSYGIESTFSGEASYLVPAAGTIRLVARAPMDSPGVELAWNAPPGEGTVSYNIYYGTQSGNYTQVQNYGNVNDFIVLGLVPGQIYYFAVTAVDAYGNESPFSNEASMTAAGPPPVGIMVDGSTAALGAVNVSWTPSPDGNVYGYCVDYWAQGSSVTNSAEFYGVTAAMISGLGGGTNYNFAISPIDPYGIETIASSVASFTVPVPQPVVLNAQTSTNPAGVSLSWSTVSNEGVVGYNVYYGTESGNYTQSQSYGNINNTVVQGLEGGQTYYFAVYPVDAYGNQGPSSNEASVVTPNPPAMRLQTKTYYDSNGLPLTMEITSPSAVYGNWEMDSSADLQNWTPYTYGYGNGIGDGYDVDVYVSIDLAQPGKFFRVINY